MDWLNTTRRHLHTRYVGRQLEAHQVLASTNDRAAALAAAGAASGTTVVADAQTHGRGRHGRVWLGGERESLLVSIILRPRLPEHRFGVLPLAIGLAVLDAVAPYTPKNRVELKWPNDVLVDGQKCAGILVESAISGGSLEAVVGIGLNVNQVELPSELAATSLRAASGRVAPRPLVLAHLLDAVEQRVDQLEVHPDALVADYSYHLCGVHEQVTVRLPGGGEAVGTSLGVDASGALCLVTDAGERRVFTAGEVSLSGSP